MLDHYKTLGLNFPASNEDIRRAYRTLARRYHPDVNPGVKSAEKFRAISEAYDILGDQEKKKRYDKILEAFEQSEETIRTAHEAYRKAASRRQQNEKKSRPPFEAPKIKSRLTILTKTHKILGSIQKIFKRKNQKKEVSEIALLEVIIEIKEAVFGINKLVSFSEDHRERKISVPIPPGSYSGSVVRLREKKKKQEELIIIIKVLPSENISISEKGVTVEIPISLEEAIFGAKIDIATYFGPLTILVPESTQSGQVIKMTGKGVTYSDKTRGDLFIRFLVQVPNESRAAGLKEATNSVMRYYMKGVREK